MFDIDKLIIREATLDDVDFIATTIIEAEKSGTDRNGTANYFELAEEEYRKYIIQMLEEEVDGCEISISSFVVAEYEGNIVAARGGWLEGANEDGLPSAILKSNLFAYIIPEKNMLKGKAKYDIVKDLTIDRESGTYQLENSYTSPLYRGYHIMNRLDEYHIDLAIKLGAKKVQGHIYQSNEKSIKACERSGFQIVQRYVSNHPKIKDYYPDDTIVLMEREL